jgi:hypothetical protein
MATAPKITIQPQFVAIGTLRLPDGKEVLVYVTKEWRRPLEQLAQQVNDIQARLTAAGIP